MSRPTNLEYYPTLILAEAYHTAIDEYYEAKNRGLVENVLLYYTPLALQRELESRALDGSPAAYNSIKLALIQGLYING